MPAKRRDAAESRFKDTAAQSSGVLTGYQQSTSPINAAYLRRNLKAYKQYGFPQDLSKLAGMTDQAREHAAAVSVIKKFKATDSPGGTQKPPTGGGGGGPSKPTGGGPKKPTGRPGGGRNPRPTNPGPAKPKPTAPKPKPKPTGKDPFGNRIPTPSQSVMDRVNREKAPPAAPKKPKPQTGPPKKPDVPVATPNRGPIRAL